MGFQESHGRNKNTSDAEGGRKTLAFSLVQNQDLSGKIYFFLTSQEVQFLTFLNFTDVRFGPLSNLAGVSFRGFSISTADVIKKFGRRKQPKILAFFFVHFFFVQWGCFF